MAKSSEVGNFLNCLRLRESSLACDGLTCKQDASAFDTLDDGIISATESVVYFKELIDKLSFILSEFCMLSTARPVLFDCGIDRP
jgi:hypothetical protein